MVISSSSSSTPRPSLLPIIVILLIISCSASFSAALTNSEDHGLGRNCSSKYDSSNTNITSYSESLNLLLVNLTNSISPGKGNGGYSKASQPWAPGLQVYGRAQCRGDVAQANCSTCITLARRDVQYCRNETIWHDHCELKYSDVDFFGKVDTDNKFTISNGIEFSNATQGDAANTFLNDLSKVAAKGIGFFANGTLTEPKSYGMAQCTRDILSEGDCKKCLDSAVTHVRAFFGNIIGVRVILGSCNVRREMYPFLK